MKNFKKILATVLTLSLCLSFAACGSSEESKADMPNPMEAVSEQGLIEVTGIDMPAPEGAEDVAYYIIKGDTPMGEMRFTLDGKKAYLRSVPTDLVALIPGQDDVEKVPEIGNLNALEGDISGLHYEWESFGTQDIQGRNGYCVLKDDVGYIAWLDVAPGILYNLCMEEGADMDALIDLAEKVFVPVQGEA